MADRVLFNAGDALATVGGMALEFIEQPEVWPAFYEWLCGKVPAFSLTPSAEVRADIQTVLAMLPPPRDAS